MTFLAPTNVASLAVGQTVKVDWSTVQQPATMRQMERGTLDSIMIYNESGIGFAVQFNNTGRSFTLPAGGWTLEPIPVSNFGTNDTSFTATAIYILNNAQVSLLLVDYTVPGQMPLRIGSLGNSPIGGAVTVPSTPTIALPPVSFPLLITGTGSNTLFSFTVPSTGLYAVYASFIVNNGGTATISSTVQFTSGFDAAVNTRNIATQGGVALSALVLANGSYGISMPSFMCRFGSTLSLTYQDSTGTPSDSMIGGVLKLF